MNLHAVADSSKLQSEMDEWEKRRLPYATATALTRTAKKVQTAFIQAMKEKFDRPTPYTLSGTFVKAATARNLVATVGWKDWSTKATPASVFMLPQVQGGSRTLKRSEKLLQADRFLPAGMFAVPGSGAKMDQYGNMSRGQIVQVLSALHAFPQTGYLANRSRAQSTKRTRLPEFFVGSPGGGRLPLGVYQRMRNNTIRPILIFTKAPNYKILIPFAAVATGVYEANFQDEFKKAMRDMLVLTPFLEAA
jgi:hypothetical protein